MAELTPQRVEEQIRALVHRLESKTSELAGLLQTAAEADVRFKVAYAKGLLRSRAKTVSEREAEALIETEDLALTRRTSEAIADACRESVRSLRDQLTVSPADHLQQIAARLDNWALDPGHPEIQAVYLHSLAWSIRAVAVTVERQQASA